LKRLSRFRIIVVLFTVVLLLNGCYWNVPINDLLSPPMLTQKQIEIFNALTNAHGGALTLKFPKSGEFLSAFVEIPPLTVENAEIEVSPQNISRVMVFYERSGTFDEPTIWLTFLERDESNENGSPPRWEATHNISFFATGIEQVEFSTLGDCSQTNVIVSTSITGQSDMNLYVISFRGEDGNTPTRVFHRNFCIFYQVGDFDDSGNNSLMSINMSSNEEVEESTIQFSSWYNGSFVTTHTVRTNPAASEYVRTLKARIPVDADFPTGIVNYDEHETVPALFIEYLMAGGDANTSIIVWGEQGQIRNVVFSANEAIRALNLEMLEKRPNQFTAHAHSRDLRGDGRVLVAGSESFPGHMVDIPANERVRAAIWYELLLNSSLSESAPNDNTANTTWRSGNFRQVYYSYLSVNNDYVFVFPKHWVGNVTVTVENEPSENVINQVTFWEFDSNTKQNVHDVSLPVMVILTVPAGAGVCRELRGDYGDFVLFDSRNNPDYDYYVKFEGFSEGDSEIDSATFPVNRFMLRRNLTVFSD